MPVDKFSVAFNVTAWFETSGNIWGEVSGNFDKQGLSFGPRQNCIGQGSLQPLLRKIVALNAAAVQQAFGNQRFHELVTLLATFSTADQLAFVDAHWNDGNNRLFADIKQAFVNLGQMKETQDTFMDDARGSIPEVDLLAEWMANSQPVSLRTWCLAYDIVTQNGGIGQDLKASILNAWLPIKLDCTDARDFMRHIAWHRSEWVYVKGNKPFAEDVLHRKLLIIEGSSQSFRGQVVNIDQMFGITDEII